MHAGSLAPCGGGNLFLSGGVYLFKGVPAWLRVSRVLVWARTCPANDRP